MMCEAKEKEKRWQFAFLFQRPAINYVSALAKSRFHSECIHSFQFLSTSLFSRNEHFRKIATFLDERQMWGNRYHRAKPKGIFSFLCAQQSETRQHCILEYILILFSVNSNGCERDFFSSAVGTVVQCRRLPGTHQWPQPIKPSSLSLHRCENRPWWRVGVGKNRISIFWNFHCQ